MYKCPLGGSATSGTCPRPSTILVAVELMQLRLQGTLGSNEMVLNNKAGLDEQQNQELAVAFELFDSDGSGAR